MVLEVTGELVDELLGRAGHDRSLGDRDHRAMIEARWLQPGEGSPFRRAMQPHHGFEEQPLRDLPGGSTRGSHRRYLVEQGTYPSLTGLVDERQDDPDVARRERRQRGLDDRSVHRVTVRRHASSAPSRRRSVVRNEVPGEPLEGELSHAFERSRFLEQVRRSGHDLQLAEASERRLRLAIPLKDRPVVPAHDQQRRRRHFGEPGRSEVGPATTGDDRSYLPPELSGSHQGRSGPGARSEEPHPEVVRFRLSAQPPRRAHEAVREQLDVEHVRTVELFLHRQEVDEERRESSIVQRKCDRSVPGAVTAAPAAVREDDDAGRASRDDEVTDEANGSEVDLDRPIDRIVRGLGRHQRFRPCEDPGDLLIGDLREGS